MERVPTKKEKTRILLHKSQVLWPFYIVEGRIVPKHETDLP
jgi:hypothetical protein